MSPWGRKLRTLLGPKGNHSPTGQGAPTENFNWNGLAKKCFSLSMAWRKRSKAVHNVLISPLPATFKHIQRKWWPQAVVGCAPFSLEEQKLQTEQRRLGPGAWLLQSVAYGEVSRLQVAPVPVFFGSLLHLNLNLILIVSSCLRDFSPTISHFFFLSWLFSV